MGKSNKTYEWASCSNILMPIAQRGVLTTKRKVLSKRYQGKGRPKKTDYDYKSIMDILCDIDIFYNQMIDQDILRV